MEPKSLVELSVTCERVSYVTAVSPRESEWKMFRIPEEEMESALGPILYRSESRAAVAPPSPPTHSFETI